MKQQKPIPVKITVPDDLSGKVKDFNDEMQGSSEPVPTIKFFEGGKRVFLDKYFVLANNTAGSDDYHLTQIVTIYNMKIVFNSNWNSLHAYANIYEKEDPLLPSFIVFYNSEKVSYWGLVW